MKSFSRFSRILSAQRQPKAKPSLPNVNQLQGQILEMNEPKPERELPEKENIKFIPKSTLIQAKRKAAFNPVKLTEKLPANPKSISKKNYKLEETITELLAEEFADSLQTNLWSITKTSLVDKERCFRVFWAPNTERAPINTKYLQTVFDSNSKIFNLAIKRNLLQFNRWSAPASHLPKVEFKFDHEWYDIYRLNKTLDGIEAELGINRST